jgi:hypothetical protein
MKKKAKNFLDCPQPGQAGTKKIIIHRRARGERRDIFCFSL